ncbi:MAG: hypothetical protein ABL874_09805 [Sphingopyxis sp.]
MILASVLAALSASQAYPLTQVLDAATDACRASVANDIDSADLSLGWVKFEPNPDSWIAEYVDSQSLGPGFTFDISVYRKVVEGRELLAAIAHVGLRENPSVRRISCEIFDPDAIIEAKSVDYASWAGRTPTRDIMNEYGNSAAGDLNLAAILLGARERGSSGDATTDGISPVMLQWRPGLFPSSDETLIHYFDPRLGDPISDIRPGLTYQAQIRS